jgi:hypothetical protein
VGASGEASAKVAGAGPRLSAAARVGLRRRWIDVVGVEAELVVNLPLLGIAEDVVGLGKSLELLFGTFIAGIDVRMVLARKFAERFADVVGGRGLLYAENAVIILVGGRGHFSAIGTQPSAVYVSIVSS